MDCPSRTKSHSTYWSLSASQQGRPPCWASPPAFGLIDEAAGQEMDQAAGQKTDQKAGQGNRPVRHRPGDDPLLAKRGISQLARKRIRELVREMGQLDTGQETTHCWPRDESVSWPGYGSGRWSGNWIRQRLGCESDSRNKKKYSCKHPVFHAWKCLFEMSFSFCWYFKLKIDNFATL
jgi:hypothetical protein